jgi:hypothetical protein
MASLSEIRGYQGNAGLGGGDIMPTKTDFDAINRAGELWALQKVNANKNIFDQKVKDRDYKRDLFEKGQIKVGNHLPEDQKIISDSQKELNDAYEKFVQAPPSDTKAFQEYQNAHTKYSDIVTKAQENYATKFQYDKEIAAEPVKSKQEAMIKHRDAEMAKGFYAMKDPYQKAIDYDPELHRGQDINNVAWGGGVSSPKSSVTGMGATSATPSGSASSGAIPSGLPTQNLTTTTVKTDKKGDKSTTVSSKQVPVKAAKGEVEATSKDIEIDPKTGFVYRNLPTNIYNRKAVDLYARKEYFAMDKNKDNMDDDINAFHAADAQTQEKIVQHIAEQIQRYNEQVGKEIGDVIPLTADDIAVKINEKDPSGQDKYALKISPAQYFALQNLASQGAFKTGGKVLDENLTKEYENRRASKEKEAIEWYKAMKIDKPKADAEIRKWDAETKGKEEVKSAALNKAKTIYEELSSLADAEGNIAGANLRKLTSEQLKYLGKYDDSEVETTDPKDPKKKIITKQKGLIPLKINDQSDVIHLDNGTIRVMQNAKLIGNQYKGYWDNNRTTNIASIATNRVNEENQLSGGKEVNNYLPIDMLNSKTPASVVSSKETSSSASYSGSKKSGNTPSFKFEAQIKASDGNVYYRSGDKILDASGKDVSQLFK